MFDIETNRSDRRANLQTRISLFQSPSSDVANPFLVVIVASQVREVGHEVTHARIRFPWTVSVVLGNFAQRVVKGLQLATRGHDFKRQLRVLGERLGLHDLRELRVLYANRRTEELRSLSNKQCVGIDQWTTARNHRNDRHIEQYRVGKESLDRRFRFRLAVGTDIQFRENERQTLVVHAPINVVIARLETCEAIAAADCQSDEVFLAHEISGDFQKHLTVFVSHPYIVEGAAVWGFRFHLGVSLRNFLNRRIVGCRCGWLWCLLSDRGNACC